MKKLALAVALLGLLVAGQGAQAVIGTVDDVPSATLLLPYFEITQGSPDSIVRGFDGIYVGDAMLVQLLHESLAEVGITSYVASWDQPCRAGTIVPLRLAESNFDLAMFDAIFESSPATSATWAPPVNTSWIDRELMYHAQRHGYTHADLKSWPGILPARLLRT